MLFTSSIFLYWFLPTILGLYYVVPGRWRSLVLTLGSYVFYGWWRPDFVALMWISTIIDFSAGRAIGRDRAAGKSGRRWVWVSCIVNLGLLGYFKYANFGIDTLNAILAQADMAPIPWVNIVLPVGISFYTFQTLSYTVDVYRGDAPPVQRFVDFACYVSMFPQLVAGPIVRYQSVAAQLAERAYSWSKFSLGVTIFQVGLAKKVLIADTLSGIPDAGFAREALSVCDLWVTLLAYSLQLYFDFSGYSDMAIGLGLLFGFRLPINFDRPYISRSFTEFWRRWHISLSSFLRDYLYIPLGGNHKGVARMYFNLVVTIVLCGLWHGANWTFIVFGIYHGVLLVLERMTPGRSLYPGLPSALQIAVTFLLLNLSWILFRSDDLSDAGRMAQSLWGEHGFAPGMITARWNTYHTVAAVFGVLIIWGTRTTQTLAETRPRWWTALAAFLFLLSLAQLHRVANVPFLYFQF